MKLHELNRKLKKQNSILLMKIIQSKTNVNNDNDHHDHTKREELKIDKSIQTETNFEIINYFFTEKTDLSQKDDKENTANHDVDRSLNHGKIEVELEVYFLTSEF